MLWFQIAGNVLYYVTLPVVTLILVVIYLLRLILSPFLYIGHALLQLILIPYNIAAKFEALWYYIGFAVLVGLSSALILHAIFRTFVFVLNLDRKPEPKPKDVPAKGHSIKSYRKAREEKRKQADKEQQELEERAKALADSPLLKDALQQMQRRRPLDDDLSPGSQKRGRGPSLRDLPLMEYSDEGDES